MTTSSDPITVLAREPIGEAYFAPVIDWHERDAGQRLMVDAILAGTDPADALLLAGAVDGLRGAADQRRGAMDGLLVCLDVLHEGGRRLQVHGDTDPLAIAVLEATGARRRALLRCTPPERAAAVLGLVLQAARAAGPYLKRAEPPAPPPPLPAPVVNVALQLPAGAVPVEVVGMPATRSVQTVTRDADDEIVETVTETRPLPAGA